MERKTFKAAKHMIIFNKLGEMFAGIYGLRQTVDDESTTPEEMLAELDELLGEDDIQTLFKPEWVTLVAQVLAALASVAGHNWSIFLKFKGGRGVATFFGGMIALCPPVALIGGEVFFVSAGLTRYASFGSILGVVSAYLALVPLTIIYKFPLEYSAYALIGGLVIIYMHRDNINRLVAGTERKIGQKAEKAASIENLGV
jgi:hypothetical protein